MKYNFLDQELWQLANEIVEHYQKSGYTVLVEQSISADYRFRPTILAQKKGTSTIVVEVRNTAQIQKYFSDFVIDCERNREPIYIYLAIPSDDENDLTNISLATNKIIKDIGVGLLTNDAKGIVVLRRARDQALRYKPLKGPKMGKYHDRVMQSIEKFNEGLPIDAVRDVTELVEEAVRDIAKKASGKKLIGISVAEANSLDLEQVIDCLSTPNYRSVPQTKIFERNLSNDLKSFKGARNLSHHPRNYLQLKTLLSQVYERMEMAVRLIREVQKINRKH